MIGGTQTGGPSLGVKGEGGHGMKKSEGFLNSRFRTHVVATAVCATGGVHNTPCHTHIVVAHFPCVTCRHRVHARLKVLAVWNVICLHLALCSHVSSAVLVVPRMVTSTPHSRRTVFVELYPTLKRGSSALPHERRGVSLATWPITHFHRL